MFSRDSARRTPSPARDREDHRQHDVIIERHLEDHRHRGHCRAGAAADHRPHADHREGRHVNRQAGQQGRQRREGAAKVAPMNSDGEKMPPDEPAPRLSEVAASLHDEQQREQPPGRLPPVEDRLDRRIADALDEIMAERLVQRVDQAPSSSMPKICRVYWPGTLSNRSSAKCSPRMNSAAATPHSAPRAV